jgi:hypothetical protein
MALIRYGAGKVQAELSQKKDAAGKKVVSSREIKPVKTNKGK